MGTAAGTIALARPGQADPLKARRVHVIFKTHLDVGYTDLARVVVRHYLENYIPRAMELARTTRENNPARRFRWTTGSWLIWEALERADSRQRARLEAAIEAGDIQWHAIPFTIESEGATASLVSRMAEISKRLDARFGKKTIAGKMTDVPGHTRSLVPHLVHQGIRYLHIGVNPASRAPAVPDYFRWRAPDGAEIPVQYNKKYYGGDQPLPGGEVVTAVMMTNDNNGPQTPEAVAKIYEELAARYPNAEIIPSTLDAIAREVLAIQDTLPVITQEIGDTWIHGFGSDPWKMARLRRLSRLRDRWIREGNWQPGSDEDFGFATTLLLVSEHTWGINASQTDHWEIQTPRQLALARRRIPELVKAEQSWLEKRGLIDRALCRLPPPREAEARKDLGRLQPSRPGLDGWEPLENPAAPVEAGNNRIALDPLTGALRGLRLGGREWADTGHLLGRFAYQTFSADHFARFRRQYCKIEAEWIYIDFGKPGLEQTGARDTIYFPTLDAAWTRASAGELHVLVRQKMLSAAGSRIPGCPTELWSEWTLPSGGDRISLDFQWFGKQATREPEALWLSFVPRMRGDTRLFMDKLGGEVAADEVISKGGRALHGVEGWAESRDAGGRFRVAGEEALLVAPGRMDLMNFDDVIPDPALGQHWCLLNNVWGTNFVMWFDDDMRFHFTIQV